MSGVELNALTNALREYCRDHTLEEKIVLAPSRRVGMQWLDAVARSGQPIFNARAETLKSLALEIAAPWMDSRGLRRARDLELEILIDGIIADLLQDGGYFSVLAPSPGLTRVVANAVGELRMADIESASIVPSAFEVAEKGLEIKAVLGAFEKRLREDNLSDYPGALALAADRLREEADTPGDLRILVPDDISQELRGLESAFLEAFPEGARVALPVDSPCQATELTPAVFNAIGEVNEVREVFRRCVEESIPLDEVEVVHTDTETYVQHFYELAVRMMHEGAEAPPVTFAEGIPARYSRPGRALEAWLAWMRGGYPQQTIVRMITDGLLEIPGARERGLSFARLGAILRAVPIAAGLNRYQNELERAIRAEKDLSKRLDGLRMLSALMAEIKAHTPNPAEEQKVWLAHARYFLEKIVRATSEMDAYCREALLDKISELETCLCEVGSTGFDIEAWLANLPASVRVGGQGPMPGCIHVSNIKRGGHSGRPNTFIVGMDDTRFPGAGLQDPLLLDAERVAMSPDLTTAGRRIDMKAQGFTSLTARLRGRVTLSYCCRSLTDDREMFPSRALVSACRGVGGEPVTRIKFSDPPASFSPGKEGRCIDMTEWWLWRMCAGNPVENPKQMIGENFANLSRGLAATDARASDEFTEYDGFVPEAGLANDCTAPDGPAISPSRLETFARCPMEYFFKHILEIELPEEFEIDPSRWLDPMEQGSLLHAVFCDFMRELDAAGLLPPSFDRDRDRLAGILDGYVRQKQAEKPPPPDPGIFIAECDRLTCAAEMFLSMEAPLGMSRTPVACELSIGVPPERDGTSYDVAEACAVALPNGKSVRVRCKLDRLDRVLDGDGADYVVCDYKTGGSGKYHSKGPFDRGRFMQGALYPALGEMALREKHGDGVKVVRFEYIFPGPTEARREGWNRDELQEGLGLAALLCDMMSSGCFAMTTDAKDLEYSEYTQAFGDIDATVKAINRKCATLANAALEPYRALREIAPLPGDTAGGAR